MNTQKSPGDLRRHCHSDSCEILPVNAGVKNPQGVK